MRPFLFSLSLYLVAAFIITAGTGCHKNEVWHYDETLFREVDDNEKRNVPDNLRPAVTIEEAELHKLAYFFNDIWQKGETASEWIIPRMQYPAQAVYLSLRSEGRRIYEIWERRGNTADAIAFAIEKAKDSLSKEDFDSIDVLEVFLGHSFEVHDLNDVESARSLKSNIHRGARGLEIVYDNKIRLYSPTYAIASNRDNSRLMELFMMEYGIEENDFYEKADVFSFEGEQLLIFLGDSPKALLMERGNIFVEPDEVSQETVTETARMAGKWLYNNVHDDGRMTYKYWPSSASESVANNMIRQWMATVALTRYGYFEGNQDSFKQAKKNINYNVSEFIYREDGYALMDCNDQVKLGALALAALALFEHPERQLWKEQEEALQKTIESLWNEDGSLTSFYRPAGDMRFQNFYPGEALLYWAFLYQREKDEALLEKIMKSFEYYRRWHLQPENRNPAFIPWHTQAYYIIWQETGYEPLKDFIFEMNDWLLDVQQWPENPVYRDILGRFYDPDRPFGPPHSSSTGVYLEGLIDAYELARLVNDYERMERYRKSINRGLRSVMQLQFADDIDMYYVSPPMRSYVEGGIRTTVYNNEIRCDNVQHNLMAILKILAVFGEDDYQYF